MKYSLFVLMALGHLGNDNSAAAYKLSTRGRHKQDDTGEDDANIQI